MQVETIPIASIAHEHLHRREVGDLSNLAADIRLKGLIQPITVTKEGKGYRLVAGKRRLLAHIELKKPTIEAVIRKTQGELDEREIELMENVSRKDFTWVEKAQLEAKIFDLRKASNPDWSVRKQGELLEQASGTTQRRITLAKVIEVMPELAKEGNEDRAWKKYKGFEEKAVLMEMMKRADQKTRDVSQWAKDHFIVGDAFKGIAKVAAGTMHFAEVDPPYSIDLTKRREKTKNEELSNRYTEIEPEKYPAFIKEMAHQVYRVLAENTYCIWWFGIQWYDMIYSTLTDAGFKLNPIPAVWVKGGPGQTSSPDTMLGSAYEIFFVARKGQPRLVKPGRSNVFDYQGVAAARKIHPTERPLDLMLELLDIFCFPNSRVIVPFLGSGVTLRACYKRQLVGTGWDLDATVKDGFLVKVKQDLLGEGRTKEDQEKHDKKQAEKEAVKAEKKAKAAREPSSDKQL